MKSPSMVTPGKDICNFEGIAVSSVETAPHMSRYERLELGGARNTFHSVRRYGLPAAEEREPTLDCQPVGMLMLSSEAADRQCATLSYVPRRSSTSSSTLSSPSEGSQTAAGGLLKPLGSISSGTSFIGSSVKHGEASIPFPKSKNCARCCRTVFQAEQIIAAGQLWHRACFRCIDCGKSLELGKFSDRAGEIFCNKCYAKEFGPKGIGCGGILQMHQ